jgi:hypothetical protein
MSKQNQGAVIMITIFLIFSIIAFYYVFNEPDTIEKIGGAKRAQDERQDDVLEDMSEDLKKSTNQP